MTTATAKKNELASVTDINKKDTAVTDTAVEAPEETPAPAKKAPKKTAAKSKAPLSVDNGKAHAGDAAPVDLDDVLALSEQMGDLGLDLAKGTSFELWEKLGDRIIRMEGATKWWIGDWARFGEGKFGEEYAQAIDPLSTVDPKTIANAAWVSGAIPLKNRVATLSWTHHRIAAELPTLTLINKALRMAVKEQFTTRQMQQFVNGLKPTEEEGGKARKKTTVAYTITFSVEEADAETGEIMHAGAVKFIEGQATERGIELTNLSQRVA